MTEQGNTFEIALKAVLPPNFVQSDLAKAINVSPSYLSLMIRGRRDPSRHVISDIADLYKLSFEQRNELLRAAGHEPVKVRPDVTLTLNKIISAPGLNEREAALLMSELIAHAVRWRAQRKAREQEVGKAVIVAAGWQARLLAPEQLETMIVQSAKEALEASIRELIIVIAPTEPLPRFQKLQSLAAERGVPLKISTVLQKEPHGLGHAILEARTKIGEEQPFAVILPVDIDQNLGAERRASGRRHPEGAIAEMKACYRAFRKPIVAVNPPEATDQVDLRRYGLAFLGKPVKGVPRLYEIERMIEKPKPGVDESGVGARTIMGRYILTPDIFDILQATPRNSETKKIELTDALNVLLENHHYVCAYDLKRALIPLSSVRALMEILIESTSEPAKLTKIIRIAQKAIVDARDLSSEH